MVGEGQPPGLSLCIGAPAFWERARADMAAARRRLFVQAMTFEGDAVGQAVAEAIAASPAALRRVLVDGYTQVNINDTRLTRRAMREPSLATEVAATDAMFRKLIDRGVAVRVTNPMNRLARNYPARDHRKLIIADDTAYVGGINFSDHNFAWPDLMLRIDHQGTADFLAREFEGTFAGSPTADVHRADGCEVLVLDGRSNATAFAPVFDLVASARARIDLVSPYPTEPFLSALGEARGRGVLVRIFTPEPNNKPTVRDALLWNGRRLGLELVLGSVMSHLKGLLIDGETLVLGSSNFDFASLAAEAEIVAIVRDRTIIADFEEAVIAPALAERVASRATSRMRGLACATALKLAAPVAGLARHSRRSTIDWGA